MPMPNVLFGGRTLHRPPSPQSVNVRYVTILLGPLAIQLIDIKNHLSRHHHDKYVQLLEEEKKETHKLEEKRAKMSIDSFLLKNFYPANSIRAKTITEALGKMIVTDMQPLSVVENKGFINFVKTIDPKYKLPTRQAITINHLPALYKTLKQKIKEKLSTASAVHLTSDMWTDTNKQFSYIAVTVHYMIDDGLYHHTLKTTQFEERHTGVNIKNDLHETMVSWNIDGKVKVITTDNGSNMVNAVSLLGLTHLPCFGHTLNLVVDEDSLKKTPEVATVLKKCDHTAHIFKSSCLATSVLNAKQQQLNMKQKSIKKRVITRWNSTLTMLRSIMDSKTAILAALNDLNRDDIPIFTYQDWVLMNDIIKLLIPFEEATETLSGSKYVTSSLVIPVVKCLLSELRNINSGELHPSAASLHKNLYNGLITRMGKCEQNKILALSTLLDPRFKDFAFASTENCSKWKLRLKNEIEQKYQHVQDDNKEERVLQTSSPLPEKPSFWHSFDEEAQKRKRTLEKQKTKENEFNSYFRADLLHRTHDPFLWWKTHKEDFPFLYEEAKQYLSIPATSVPSERVFSKAGLTLENRRSNLKPKHVDMLIFLNMNSEL